MEQAKPTIIKKKYIAHMQNWESESQNWERLLLASYSSFRKQQWMVITMQGTDSPSESNFSKFRVFRVSLAQGIFTATSSVIWNNNNLIQ